MSSGTFSRINSNHAELIRLSITNLTICQVEASHVLDGPSPVPGQRMPATPQREVRWGLDHFPACDDVIYFYYIFSLC